MKKYVMLVAAVFLVNMLWCMHSDSSLAMFSPSVTAILECRKMLSIEEQEKLACDFEKVLDACYHDQRALVCVCEKAKELVEHGVNLECLLPRLITLSGCSALISSLLEHGARSDGLIAYVRDIEVARVLVANGAKINEQQKKTGKTLLACFIDRSLDDVIWVLSKGADPNVGLLQEELEETVFCKALLACIVQGCDHDSLEKVVALLQKGARVDELSMGLVSRHRTACTAPYELLQAIRHYHLDSRHVYTIDEYQRMHISWANAQLIRVATQSVKRAFQKMQ